MKDSEKKLFEIAATGSGEDLANWRKGEVSCSVNCRWSGGDEHNRGETPLLVALFNKDKAVFIGLLRMGSDPAIEDSRGRCVLEILEDWKNMPSWVDERILDLVEQYHDRYLDLHTIKTDSDIICRG